MPRLVPPAIVLLFVMRLPFIRQVSAGLGDHKSMLLLPLLYLVYCVSFLWSPDPEEAAFDLQVKLSLIVLPLVMLSFSRVMTKESRNRLLRLYSEGSIAAIIICLGQSVYRFYLTEDPGAFSYTRFSVIIHPSYFSLYLLFAFLITSADRSLSGSGRLLRMVVIAGGIILCGSRTGWIVAGITAPLIILSAPLSVKHKMVFVLITGIFLTANVVFTENFSRLKVLYSSGISESVSRPDIWKASWEAGVASLPFGSGSGSEKRLIHAHLSDEASALIIKRDLNSHNQYLQSFIAIGLGVLVLIFLFVSAVWQSVVRRDRVLLFLCIFTALNFMTESMLETQAGVVFFGLFFSLMMLKTKNVPE